MLKKNIFDPNFDLKIDGEIFSPNCGFFFNEMDEESHGTWQQLCRQDWGWSPRWEKLQTNYELDSSNE